MQERLSEVFQYLDKKVGPSRLKHKPACYETREMLMECVIQSDCMK